MIKKVAFRYILAKTMDELIAGTSRKVVDRASSLSVINNNDGSFTVTGGKGKHTVKVQRKGVDVKVSCTCNGWVFQGSEYYADKRNYLLGKPKGTLTPPRIRDPKGINLVCKHVVATFQQLQAAMIRMGKRENILKHKMVQKDVCQSPTKWDNVLDVIEFDDELDFTTKDEFLIADTIRKDQEYQSSFNVQHPNVYRKGRKVKDKNQLIKAKFIISFTEHAITRVIARGFNTKTLVIGILRAMDDPKKFAKKFTKGKKNDGYIKVDNALCVLYTHSLNNPLSYRNKDNNPDAISYIEEVDKIVLGKNIHFRVHTVYDPNDKGYGNPLGAGNAGQYLPCLVETDENYDTHDSKKQDSDYDWKARFGTMVKSLADRWLLQ
jgi:hypothetical protein